MVQNQTHMQKPRLWWWFWTLAEHGTECEGAVFDSKNLSKTRYGWEGNQRFVVHAALAQGLIAPRQELEVFFYRRLI